MRVKRHSVCALILAALSGLLIAACGGSSSKSSSNITTSAGGSGNSAQYAAELQEAYKGTDQAPSGPTIKPPKGKNVWVISTGQTIETAQDASKAMEEAATKLGWQVKVFDGKFESSRELAGVEQALAAKAEGIVLLYIDCAPVKAALLQARAAHVPVVGIESNDCSPSLENNVEFGKNESFLEWEHKWAGTQAKWVIAKTQGHAKTVLTEETDLSTTKAAGVGIREQFKKCPGCEIVQTIGFVGTELGPALQQKTEQALTQHPDTNSFIAAYDAILTSGGGAAALRASGRLKEINVAGGEGSKPGIELIYNQAGNDACTGLPTAWTGYEAFADLARIFSGKNVKSGSSGIGVQACDKEHNLPPKGSTYIAPVNYVADYEKQWGLRP